MTCLHIVESTLNELEIIEHIVKAIRLLDPYFRYSISNFTIPGTNYVLTGARLGSFYFICGGDFEKMALLLYKASMGEITGQDIIKLIDRAKSLEDENPVISPILGRYAVLSAPVEKLLK